MVDVDMGNACSQLDLEIIKKRILQTSTVAWDQKIPSTSLEKWLNNFSGEALGDIETERALAAWLLMNFTFYTEKEVKEFCRIIYRKYVNIKLKLPQYKQSDLPVADQIKQILNHTIFVRLGNASESGARVLYDFRVANSLSKDIFDEPMNWSSVVEQKKIEDIVMIDDVTLSGSQAISYIGKLPKLDIKPYLLTFFATPTAIETLKEKAPDVIPLYAVLLDERTELFSDESFAFSNESCATLKPLLKKMCLFYGKKIVENELPAAENYMKKWPLGFRNGQQMFGFYYNTPDNTLPIFWCESVNWSAAFKRHPKIYNIEGVEISDEQYW